MDPLRATFLAVCVAAALVTFPAALGGQSQGGDARVLAVLRQINAQLARSNLNIAAEQIEFFTIATWSAAKALKKVKLVRRADTGADPDIFDSFVGFGGFGNPFLADIVNAGWLPRAFFEAVGGPGGGRGILAFSVTFIHR